ncbi:MAG TPA: lyase family protein, partial [Chitinophagaceae bacterium]|nr:lyase family protein [Chitinophagaceae bacterium]
MTTHKLWQKGEPAENELTKKVTAFTAGKDKQLDLALAPYDVLGSIAHVMMLGSVKLITAEEKDQLVAELRKIYHQINTNNFSIRPEAEDIHSEIEFRLTETLGETGKKVHTGRSRNDQ